MATAPVIGAKKNEVSYAIANITLFGILSMLIYPYFANYYFDAEISNDELYFDYLFKKGVCKNMNASFLLKKMEII